MTKPKFDLYQEVTDRLVEALEAGTPPWRKPWTGDVPGFAFPLRSTGEHYRGINVLMLWLAAEKNGFASPYWFTYRQSQEAGGQVRKGEKSAIVVKYGTIDRTDAAGDPETIPYLRAYRVFNADQCDGLPDRFHRAVEPPRDLGTQPDPTLDAWFVATGLTIETSDEPDAYYDRRVDRIHMPPINTFVSAARYYGVLAHEAIHASGSVARLDRFSGYTSKADRAREELIAEIGGAMICASLGIVPDYSQNAVYLASWIKALKEDKREIFRAASAAQKGADYLHGLAERHSDSAEAA